MWNQVSWSAEVARSEGTDPYVVYGLPVRHRVCGVRVRFVIVNPHRPFLMLQMFWSDSRRRGVEGERNNSSILVVPRAQAQSAVFHVDDTIDRIRLDPGIEPGTLFELTEVVLLTRRENP
jgi:hypothetical protein